MKRLYLSLIVVFSVLSINSIPAFAKIANPIPTVSIGGEQIKFKVAPTIEDGTTLVQFRPIFEKLGLEIKWDGDKKQITGSKEGLLIVLTIGSTTATVNGKEITLQKAPKIVDGNTVIPLRFVGESAGNEVKFNKDIMAITIDKPEIVQVTPEPNVKPTHSQTPTPDVVAAPKTMKTISASLENAKLFTIKFNENIKKLDLKSISIIPRMDGYATSNLSYSITTKDNALNINFNTDLTEHYIMTISDGAVQGDDDGISDEIKITIIPIPQLNLLSKNVLLEEHSVSFHISQGCIVYFMNHSVGGSREAWDSAANTSSGKRIEYSSGGDYTIDVSGLAYGGYTLMAWGQHGGIAMVILDPVAEKAKQDAQDKLDKAAAEQAHLDNEKKSN